MCHNATLKRAVRCITLLLGVVSLASAQSPGPTQSANWRRVGGGALELMLASPATGPVASVWYSFDGSTLYARTRSGKVYETTDYEVWTPSAVTTEVPLPAEPVVMRKPEEAARIVPAAFGRIYALGRQLFRSDDGGRTWANLTAFKSESVIGTGQTSVATSNVNPDQVVAANRFGVWRSMDGGLSWSGLNQFLPNLEVKRILATPNGTAGTRIEVAGVGAAELAPGSTVWTPVQDAGLDAEAANLKRYSAIIGSEVRSIAMSGDYVYLGTADGRILVAQSNSANFLPKSQQVPGPVERIWVDPTRPVSALAAVGGTNGSHVWRTTNGGLFWDSLDSTTLPNVPAHGIYGERATSAAYVATDRGVFSARVDLDAAGSPVVNWTRVSDQLPANAAAMDVRLDPSGTQLFVAIDGYGVYAATAPHRMRSLRIVNGADLSTRAAAPGSLLSVVGGRVRAARGGDLDYPVLAAGDDGSQIQVPFAATGPNVRLALSTANGPVQLGLQVLPVSPAIFVGSDGVPMMQDADTGLLLNARNAAKSGAHVQLFATGLGRVRPEWPDGSPAPMDSPPAVAANIRAFVNGAPAPVTKATLAPGYVGFYQIELQLPGINNAGVAELYITADGVESNRVQLVIE